MNYAKMKCNELGNETFFTPALFIIHLKIYNVLYRLQVSFMGLIRKAHVHKL